MMRLFLIVILIFFLNQNVCSQISCDSILIHIYQEQQIKDTIAFCDGVTKALNYNGLAIRSVGDPNHLSECYFQSYRKHGVDLLLTGDIIISRQMDENIGFNSVMIPKIKDSIGEKYEELGKIDSLWIDINDQELYDNLMMCFEPFEILSDTTVLCKLNMEGIKKSIFGSLDGVTFIDSKRNNYVTKDLIEGVVYPLSPNFKFMMIIDFKDYHNGNNICQAAHRRLITFNLKK